MMLTINVQDKETGLAEVKIEKGVSDSEDSDIELVEIKQASYKGKKSMQTEEIKVSAPYQKYLREIKITATDRAGNKNEYKIENLKVQGTDYIITTKEELQEFAKSVNEGKAYQGITVQLGNDIDLSEIENWTPIGNNSYQFKGTFDGNGHAISNMKIQNSSDEIQYYIGLFGYTGDKSIIKNLYLNNYSIVTTKCIRSGGLVGINYADIMNVNSSGKFDIKSSSSVEDIGGLVGLNYKTIENCSFEGSIKSEGSHIGGLVGENRTENSNIKKCYAKAEVQGERIVGGLVGNNSYGKIEKCYAEGSVTSSSQMIGGLVGSSSYGTIINCYAKGNVNGENNYVAGLIGSCGTTTKVENCYASVKITSPWTGSTVEGLVANKATITSSYWDTDVSGIKATETEGYGTGKTTEKMKKQETYENWDFSTVWEWVENDYPRLRKNSN